MKREIVRDIIFLQRHAEAATPDDAAVAVDLKDTLEAHLETCAGLAANMIGSTKAIIAFRHDKKTIIMYNPEIVKTSKNTYETEEGCRSLTGTRPCTRFETIEVQYEDVHFKKKRKKFTGFTAEVIQHEVDHLHGILI